MLTENLSPGARLIAALGPVAAVAQMIGVSSRSVAKYRGGGVPSRTIRARIAERCAIPETAWFPAPPAFEAELGASLAQVIGEYCRKRHAELQVAP